MPINFTPGGLVSRVFPSAGSHGVPPANSGAVNQKPQSNVQLFQTSVTSLSSVFQTINVNNIKAPNNHIMSNLQLDIEVIDTTGATTAPAGVNSIDSAITSFSLTGATGAQLINLQNANAGDPFEKLQHRLNPSGYYNTPPTPADSSTSTSYTADYNVLLNNWTVYPQDFAGQGLSCQIGINTLSSRATTLNSMTSTIQITAYADFVPLANPLPRTVLRQKPVTGIAAANFDFGTYLDTSPILDLSIDVGSADSKIASGGAINILQNNVPLISNSAYQNVINREDQLYNITTPHITGYFPLNVLRGMTMLNAAVNKESVQINFASAPNASGTSGQANVYMIEAI